VRPSACAVIRFTTKSNLVGEVAQGDPSREHLTGMSAGHIETIFRNVRSANHSLANLRVAAVLLSLFAASAHGGFWHVTADLGCPL
jgi:hypothetical protein